ncbi:phage protease [Fulvimonas yonginensis]|uniref:Phage protease n=1 Tax=Fulvimonas yonginensis TaxID=1495200 RepID=A0ABU8JA57_9GAMM
MARSPLAIALAACAFQLPALADGNAQRIQLTPAGNFKPWDGRDIPSGHWHIDQAVANAVIARFQARKNPRVLDYEHQTLRKEENGQPAPAAGWITDLQWVDGQGLFGTVELTARARQLIADGEYRYVSPVFSYDRHTGDVLDIQMAAITNNPAIDGMEPLALRAAATFGFHSDEDPSMNKLLLAVCAALALGADTTEDQAIAALNAHAKNDPLAGVRKALGVDDKAAPEAIVTACSALKTKAEQAGNPDPAKFVPITVVEDLKGSVAALTAQINGDKVEQLVTDALEDGRLLKAQENWARDLGKKDIAALTAYLETAQPIAALAGTQTGGRGPAQGKDANGLTPDELAVCNATGIDPKDFAAAKTA